MIEKYLGFTLDCSISRFALAGHWKIVFDIVGFHAIAKTPRATNLGCEKLLPSHQRMNRAYYGVHMPSTATR